MKKSLTLVLSLTPWMTQSMTFKKTNLFEEYSNFEYNKSASSESQKDESYLLIVHRLKEEMVKKDFKDIVLF